MKIKITIPEDISDITLDQYQQFEILNDELRAEKIDVREYNKQKISLFSGIPYNRMDHVQHVDLESVLSDIDKALEQECKFVNRFFINEIEFGLIPNFQKITSGEFFDLQAYSKEQETDKGIPIDTLNKLMAVLFRPIKRKDKLGNYNIKEYDITEYHIEDYHIKRYKGTQRYGELMKQMPLNIVKGSLVFFWSLSKELQRHITRSTVEAQVKEQKRQTSLVNGGGMIPSAH